MSFDVEHQLGHDEHERADARAADEEATRQLAIQQIERRRHFHIEAVVSAVGMLILVGIWATSEYHNAGGWPTDGFSQSSSIPNVWNYWIVYPLIGWALVMAVRAWSVYGGKPISERDIQREIDRQTQTRSTSSGPRTSGHGDAPELSISYEGGLRSSQCPLRQRLSRGSLAAETSTSAASAIAANSTVLSS